MPLPAVTVHEKRFHQELQLSQSPTVSGCKAIKWEEGTSYVASVTIGVDPNCLFFYWTDQHRKSECLDLAVVRDTRTGDKKAHTPRDKTLSQLCLIGEEPTPERCMTIVCGNSYVDLRFISFIFTKRSDAQFWTNELFQLAYNYKTQNISLERTLLKTYTKLKITSASEVRITVKDIIQYFYTDKDDRRRCERTLESHKNDPILLEKFQFKDFLRLYSQIVPRPDLESIFISLTGSKSVKFLTAEQMRDFLNRTQRDPRLNEILHPYATTETARVLIDKYEPHESSRSEGRLSQDGFIRFLLSDANSVVSPSCFTLHQDMSHPLSHYFINSSHNTYLLGAQIKGKSSSEMYRQALLTGCRCVELDCWPEEDGKDILITHGRTFTEPIAIKDALEAISDYAFKTSDYPLILSLENRCPAKLQDKLGRYLKRYFGPALLDQALSSHPLETGVALPSPEALKNCVLVKNKKRAPTVGASPLSGPNHQIDPTGEGIPEDALANDNSDTDDESDDTYPVEAGGLAVSQEATAAAKQTGRPPVVQMVETELSRLVNYVQPTRFDSFEAAKKRDRAYECVSLVEDHANVYLKKDPVHFIDFNKRQMTRVYPNATRVKSTNFLPFFFWSAGCQMVALNVQTADLGMQLNTGVFEINGRSGYLTKPELMRQKNRTLDPFTESNLDGVVPASISIRIITGLMLSLKRISTFVEVDIYGIFADINKKNHRTRACQNNGQNPQYDQTNQPFTFRVMLPEMAYLRISVREERTSRLIGHCLLPVSQFRPGYRHVVLRNEIGQTLPATVFIFTDVKDYVPNYQIDLANALENPIRHQNEHDRKEKMDQLINLTNDLEDQDPEVIEQAMAPKDPLPGNGAPPQLAISNGEMNGNGGNHSELTPPVRNDTPEKIVHPLSACLVVDRAHRESTSTATPSGTPYIGKPRSGSGNLTTQVQPENPDDLAAHQRLQAVHAPVVEELKRQTKAIQKTCSQQDKDLQKLRSKYEKNIKRLEMSHAKERERVILVHDKSRTEQEKRGGGRTTGGGDADGMVKLQEGQWWELLKRQAEAATALRMEYYRKELDLNLTYHETFYRQLEAELNLQQLVMNEQLKSVNTFNVEEIKKKLSQQASKELAELKTRKDLDKSQLEQRRDDVTQKNIRQGVSIAKKYEILYEDRRKILTEEIEMLLQKVKREKSQVELDLREKFDAKRSVLEDELKKNSSPHAATAVRTSNGELNSRF
ncbi:1-phosphatidylinositol 4,5-bisphosphate phosphodiesterase beta-1 [Hypsibius exemplaris]|uniref:1-phosphatidylinositol 4,5-bisphosphate phosphodiesterase n=1 Tax=Hypsibius exemplaris TaxID=2072580 RepID=A0A1W0X8P1_HYPEX|nr:1-phosphatidylinositol 4,5-bisphosphate phosphodiesterase beta-1 [Hypsibius exemplaris]